MSATAAKSAPGPRQMAVRFVSLATLLFALMLPLSARYRNGWLAERIPESFGPGLMRGIAAQLTWDWLVVGLLAGVVLVVERRPLGSVGLARPSARVIRWVFVIWIGLQAATFAVMMLPGLASSSVAQGATSILELPLWFRVVLLVTVSVTEETIYRGYAIERITELTGSVVVAGVVTFAVFSLAHVPFFGWAWFLTGGIGTAALTLLYVRTRNLPACMLLHFLGDVFILAPSGAIQG